MTLILNVKYIAVLSPNMGVIKCEPPVSPVTGCYQSLEAELIGEATRRNAGGCNL